MDEKHFEIFAQGVGPWNKWRLENPQCLPNLSAANLKGFDLAGFDLHEVDLRGGCLREATLTNANLEGAKLRDADLTGANLSDVGRGLKANQLAGTDLTSALLPETLANSFQDLGLVKEISESAQKLFVAMLAACLYSWLTIGTTSDLNLITNRATSALPIIQTSIPIVGFYFIAPVLLLLAFFYFHFYLQKLWEELGALPAFFPDGLPVSSKADPWLLNDLVRSHVSRLRGTRPFMSFAQEWISVFLAWWIVPITLIVFWARYLRRHDIYGTTLHGAAIVLAFTGAIFSYKLAGRTLQGVERRQLQWSSMLSAKRVYATVGAASGFLFVIVAASHLVMIGNRSRTWDATWWKTTHGIRTIMPRIMQGFGYSPFADLRGKEVSTKPANWDAKVDPDYRSVIGAELNSVDLREADMTSVFLPNAILNHAHMEDANLLSAELRRAQLIGTHLEGADLLGANLKEVLARGAHFSGADLTLANLTGAKLASADLSGSVLTRAIFSQADLTYTNLQNTAVTVEQLKDAQHVDLAYMSDELANSLKFPKNHNTTVRKSEKEELDQKGAESDELARLDALSGLPGGDATADSLRVNISGFRTPTLSLSSTQAHTSKSFTVKQLMRIYDYPDLDGEGQTIGIIELGGGFNRSDLAGDFKRLGVPTPDITTRLIDGAKNKPSGPHGPDTEVELNVEIAGTIAPKAKIVVYFTVNTDQGYIDAVKAAIDDTINRPTVIMTAWGSPENQWTRDSIQALDRELHRAADAGITFVAGAGERPIDAKTQVDFPASSQWVLAVGGTRLETDGMDVRTEFPWNDDKLGATGAGPSGVFPLPEWQKEGARLWTPGRSIPDVSIDASPSSGYLVIIDKEAKVFGGSSVSVTMWAGLVALLNQGLGRNVGYFNKLLYTTIGPSDAFNYVPRRQDLPSRSGWTPQSGWGTPDGRKLLAALRRSQ